LDRGQKEKIRGVQHQLQDCVYKVDKMTESKVNSSTFFRASNDEGDNKFLFPFDILI